MKKAALKLALAALVVGIALPVTLHASEEDLQKKIDKLGKEIDDLTGQVKKDEAKSLGKWLSIGGDFRYRLDSLHGRTVPYTDAISTFNNLVRGVVDPVTGNTVGGFVNGVAGSNIGGNFTSPNAAQFMMMGKAGTLFTPDQFNTILNQYMPQAMYGAMQQFILTPNPNQAFFAPGAVVPAAVLQATALTSQQQSILNTLTAKVMPTVMGMSAVPFGGAPGSTVGQLLNSGAFSADQIKLLNNLLMQTFLGQNSGNLKMVPAYKPKNETLQTNRFGLDLHAKATQDVTVNVKLDMYKTFGAQTDAPTTGNLFADRVGVFDGTLSHVPSTSLLNVDRAFATWSNIADQPVWFSVGRRPSTNGAPNNLRLNNERPGNGGIPALLVDYAFDGMTLGWAPDIETLPGAYAKVCYGRAFESGFKTTGNTLKDTEVLGVAIVPVDTDPLRIWLQWNRAWDIFDFQTMQNTVFGNTAPATNLGSGDWYGIGAMGNIKKVGPGNLNFFSDFGMSITHANHAVSQNAGFEGLMTGGFFAQEAPSDKTGYAVFTGIRYDLPSRTKLGFEFNHGTKNWIPFAAASDDMWTGKLGTRGNVFEPYIIQELNLKPISSYISKVFFRLGYQYYDFDYTGSNNWVGAPVKISSIKSTDLMLLAPVKEAHDVYATFEVHF